MRTFSALLAIGLLVVAFASTSSLADDKVLIAPVQGNEIVEADRVVELEEAVRAGAMKRAHELGLAVMSHKVLARSLDDLRKDGRDKAIGLPCKDAKCDGSLGRALDAQLAVSTRLTERDGKFLALMRVVATDTDKVLATSSVETDTFASLLAEVTKQAERMIVDGRAAAAKPRLEPKQH